MRRLDQTIADLEAQTLQPDEIIITDAGSTDGTFERLQEWSRNSKVPVVVLQKHRCNVAQGRNIAIKASKHNLIASTDFGCRFLPAWLESIISPFGADPKLEVVGGAFTIIRDEVNTPAAKADFVLSKGYAVIMDEYFSVSSRSIAYNKSVWERIGGYPEWLTLAADDTIFWRHVKKQGFKYLFVHEPNVFWLRHKTFKGFGKENFRYGLGDGESAINFRNFLSHVIETGHRWASFVGIVALPYLLVNYNPVFSIIIAAQPAVFRSYKYAYKTWKQFKHLPGFGTDVLLACFWMVEVTRVWYIRGYLKGRLGSTPEQKLAAIKLKQDLG